MIRALGALAAAATVALALLVAAGFGGALHPALDSIGHFRAHLAAALAAASAAALLIGPAGPRRWGALGLAAALGAAATVAPFLRPSPDAAAPATLTVLQMNVLYRADPAAALARIEAAQPDVVTLQEVTARTAPAFTDLSAYPHHIVCGDPSHGILQVAILSRHRFASPPACDGPHLFVAVPVSTPAGPVTIAAFHARWPWPYGQWPQLAALGPRFAALAPPVILGGDFNAAPWSAAVRRVARETGTEPVRGLGPTWLHPALPAALAPAIGLPLDHVLLSPGWRVLSAERLAPTGSDHRPVLVRIAAAL